MTNLEFEKIIGKAVGIELRKLLPELLNEYFKPSSTVHSNMPTTNTPPVNNPSNPSIRTPIKSYVKDPILNQLLNETVVTIPAEGQSVSAGINTETLPPSLTTAFTKDYSALLKLSKSKRG